METVLAIVLLFFVFVIIPRAAWNTYKKLKRKQVLPYDPQRDCRSCGGWGNINGRNCGCGRNTRITYR